MKKNLLCKVVENIQVSDSIYKITLDMPDNDMEIRPGQFFNFKCGEGNFPLLRRPISIALAENNKMVFYINKIGEGTELLSKKSKGDYINILGPLGNGFDIEIEGKNILVIGGGIGVAPLLELTKNLSSKSEITVDVMLGFKDRAIMTEEYQKYTDSIMITLENDSKNNKGYITDILNDTALHSKYDYIFSCGPKAMLKKVKSIADKYSINSQLLMEERMACGIGACLVCTCKVKKGDDNWTYTRTCKEGPVFYGEEVIFDE